MRCSSMDEEDDYDEVNYYSEGDPATNAPEILSNVGRELNNEDQVINGWKRIAEELLTGHGQRTIERIARSNDPGCTTLRSWIGEKGNAAKLGVLQRALDRIQRRDIVEIFNEGLKKKCQLSAVLQNANGVRHEQIVLSSGRRPLWRVLRFWINSVSNKRGCRSYFRFVRGLDHMKWNDVSQKFIGMEIGIRQVDEDMKLDLKQLATDMPVVYLDHSKTTMVIESSTSVAMEQTPNQLENDSSLPLLSDVVWNLEESP